MSCGKCGVILDNYVGSNFYEIKGKLEAYGLKVESELKDVVEDNDKELNKVGINELVNEKVKELQKYVDISKRNKNEKNCIGPFGQSRMNCAVLLTVGISRTMCLAPCSIAISRKT